MSLVKTVELRILADAADAHRQLDEVAAEADKLDGNAIRMRFRVDGAEGKAQLDEIRAKADRLGFKDVSIKVRVDGAGRAIADLLAVKHEEDKVRDAGIMNRIGGLVGAAGGGIPGSLGPVPLPALAAAVPLVGALATEAVGVASGFAAAGAGAGAFALLALPAVKKVETAYQGLGKAQAAYQLAQEKEAADPTKAHKTALAGAALNLKLAHEQIARMPPAEQGAIRGISGLTDTYHRMSKAFEKPAFKVFNDGLSVANHLLPHAVPFANTFATSVDGLLKRFDKFTQSKGFSDFLKQFHSIEGPAITSIGSGIGKVAGAFGKLMTVMSGKDVSHAINIAFGAIGGAINVVTFAIRRGMQNFDQMKSAARTAAHGIASAFDTVRHAVATVVSSVAHGVGQVVMFFVTLPGKIVGALAGLPGKIKGVFADAIGWLVQAGKNIVQGLINGLGSMIGAVVGMAKHIGSSVWGAITGFFHFGSPSKLMFQAGQWIGQGLALGMRDGTPVVAAAGRGLGTAALGGYAAAVRGTGYGRGGGDLHVHFHGITPADKYATAQQIHQVMRDYKRNRGGAALGLA